VIVFRSASHSGADVSYSVDRSGPVEGSTVVYTGPEDVKVASTQLTVRFYSQAGGAGSLVGTASATVPVGTDGTVSTSVATQGVIQTVEVPADQVLNVGERRALGFGAKDGEGDLVAVTPGSATWTISSGGDKLTISDGEATGVAIGDAQVTATVDGKTSAPATVSVVNPGAITVAVSPSSLALPPRATQQFTAAVQGASDTSVTWSVVENGGGTITPGGLYTAPAAPGTYTVKATSVANPEKSATATVQVENVGVSVSPETVTVRKGATVQLTANVTGTANHNVTWSIPQGSAGTVTPTGLYTAPDAPGTYTVRATSQANTAVFAQATVTVEAATFEIIAVMGNADGDLPMVNQVNVLSEDGSTIGGASYQGSAGTKATYWTKESGWVLLNTESGVLNTEILAVSADGNYLAGTGFRQLDNRARSFRWNRAGNWLRVPPSHPDERTDPTVTAISDDGETVYGDLGGFGTYWKASSPSLSVMYGERFIPRSVSSDGLILAGEMREVNGVSTPAIWTPSGIERVGQPGGHAFKCLSADGTAAITQVQYWSRSTGFQFLSSSVLHMSRNGQYVIYADSTDVYLWSRDNGAVPLKTVLVSAGAPSDIVIQGDVHRISGDGKTIVGTYYKKVGGQIDGSRRWVYRCVLPTAP
jgi:plastocyanin